MQRRRPARAFVVGCGPPWALARLGWVLAWALLSLSLEGAANASPAPNPVGLDPKGRVGSWIWADATFDKQTCRFWKAIQIPPNTTVVEARLLITADNSYTLYLDGQELGRGTEYRALREHDVTLLLSPGTHVLAVEAFNDYAEAGVLAGLRVELNDGRVLDFPSDASWRLVPNDAKHWITGKNALPQWRRAKIVAPLGGYPWTFKEFRIFREPPIRPVTLKFWQMAWFQITLLSVCGLAILVCLRLFGQLALQRGAQRILERERARIALDIHDDLGAGLTQLVLFGEVAQRELAPGTDARAKFDWLCEKGRSLLSAIDETVWAVNSRRDTFSDFETYVCSYAEKFLKSTPIRCSLEADADIPDSPFSLASRRNLFLAIKEALNNAAKHSGATELTLNIHLQANTVSVTIEDNGRGFDLSAASRERNGLSNMAQRAAEAGGACRIISRAGAGCRVELSAPLVHPANRSLIRWWKPRVWASQDAKQAASRLPGK